MGLVGANLTAMLVGVACLVVGGLAVWRAACAGSPYRSGPWPGLTQAGAAVLLGCGLLLAGGQVLLGDPRSAALHGAGPQRPVPDLVLLAILAVCPMALATRLVGAPGAASAMTGAYLLPRTLLSLLDPTVAPPPLLLVPALAFDVTAWLRLSDLANLRYAWPGRHSQWRRRRVTLPHSDLTPGETLRSYAGGRRRGLVGPARGGVAGAAFGGALALIQPPFALLLGADPTAWTGPNLWLAGGLATLGCATAACAITALPVSARGTAA